MSVPTVNVTVTIYEQDGSAVEGATVEAELIGVDRYNNQIVGPIKQTQTTDANGQAVLALFPNTLGERNTFYRFKATHPTTGKKYVDVTAVVPNSNVNLAQIERTLPTEPYDPANQPYSAMLTSFASLVGAADKVPYFTGASSFALADFTSYARTLVAAASAAAARSVLGLGLLATITAGSANALSGMDAAGAAHEWKTLTGTANQVAVTHGVGSVTLSLPQNIHAGASPTFAGLTLTGNLTTNVANTRVIYSASGVATGSANLTFNGTTLTAHTLTVSTGALTVTGGTITTGSATALSLATTGGTFFQGINVAGANRYITVTPGVSGSSTNATLGVNSGSLQVTSNALFDGNVTVGDASSDTLTVNSGTWTIGSNVIATRAVGTAAAGVNTPLRVAVTYSGNSEGTTDMLALQHTTTSSGSNSITASRASRFIADHAGSATASNVHAGEFFVIASSSGNVTAARAVLAQITTQAANTIATASHYEVVAPSISGGGSITTLRGLFVPNIGSSSVSTAVGVLIQDFSGSTTMRGIQSSLTSGTGKHNLYIDGTALSEFAGEIRLASSLSWESSFGGSADLVLLRDAANTLAQRNGTSTQAFRLYNTFTDASNFERWTVFFASGTAIVGTTQLGTGVARAMRFQTGGVASWELSISGNLLCVTDNTYDIGASGANRPRDLFLGRNITTGAPSGGTAATWKLGTVASVSPTSPNRTIEVEVGGTTYYVHAKTTNN